jgi:hypothetical protein
MENIIRLLPKTLKYQTQVDLEGKIELQVPLIPGANVTIFVIEESDSEKK